MQNVKLKVATATEAKRMNIFKEDLYRELQKWKRRASP